MEPTYDPAVIHKEAARLYSSAYYAVLGSILIGGAIGYLAGLAFSYEPGILAVGGLIIGAAYGESRAAKQRLEAQRLLVLAAIEKNTRRE